MKTNICLLIILSLLLSTQSFGQAGPEDLDYFKKMEQARKMKNGGATLTVLGGILMIAGGLTVRSSIRNGNDNGETGAILFVIGIGGIASGIPLMAVGERDLKKYKEKSQGLNVRINADTRSTGLTLSYRF